MTNWAGPSLAWAEIGSAIWKAVRRGDIAARDARELLNRHGPDYHRIDPLDEYAEKALALAIELRHPIYDCFYLALGRARRAAVTADEEMIAAARKAKIKVRRI